jgi:hypothetical protein
MNRKLLLTIGAVVFLVLGVVLLFISFEYNNTNEDFALYACLCSAYSLILGVIATTQILKYEEHE